MRSHTGFHGCCGSDKDWSSRKSQKRETKARDAFQNAFSQTKSHKPDHQVVRARDQKPEAHHQADSRFERQIERFEKLFDDAKGDHNFSFQATRIQWSFDASFGAHGVQKIQQQFERYDFDYQPRPNRGGGQDHCPKPGPKPDPKPQPPVGDGDHRTGPNSPDQQLDRLFKADYADGTGAMSGQDRPNAREISNAVSAAETPKTNTVGATDLFWAWGQFLDHDLSLSPGSEDPADAAPIDIPAGDPRFDPTGAGDKQLMFTRSATELDRHGVAQQKNAITPLLDGSNVYGSTKEEEAALRTGDKGLMILQDTGELPTDERGFYQAGDERVNENPILSSLHTLFVREHNRLAKEIGAENPSWSDDQIFDLAQDRNIAQMQVITEREFLPILLGHGERGPGALGKYTGYDKDLDPQITNEFSTAAYRFGHSMVSDQIVLIDEQGNRSEMPLNAAFFNPSVVKQNGIDDILKGAASQQAQAMDLEIVDSLRNNVIPGPAAMPLDLAALNIQRGRDHGIPSMNDIKRGIGQPPLTGFDDPRLRDGAGEKLAQVYDSIEDVDAWVGMLAERPVKGGLAGETQAAVLTEQFLRTRNADPDWYLSKYSGSELRSLKRTTLADIIERNTSGVDLQDFAMLRAPDGRHS